MAYIANTLHLGSHQEPPYFVNKNRFVLIFLYSTDVARQCRQILLHLNANSIVVLHNRLLDRQSRRKTGDDNQTWIVPIGGMGLISYDKREFIIGILPITMSTGRLYRSASIGLWLTFLAALTFVFSWLLDKQHNPNQSNISRITQQGTSEVVLKRNRAGHYVANGMINGSTIQFLLDTGATDVSVPENIARVLKLKPGISMTAQTANGSITVYSTKLETVSLGGIEISNVAASINPAMAGKEVLLGMSFLGVLEMIQRGDTLTLRVPSNQ